MIKDDKSQSLEVPNQGQIHRLCALILVLVLWHVIYLPSLGFWEFQGEETRRVLPAVNMLIDGDWIVPSIAGEDYFNKPPGINWPVALAYWLTGEQNEFNARMVSTLFTLAAVMVIMLGRGKWLGVNGRFIASVIFMTCATTLEKGRLIEIEGVYVPLTMIAVVWWLDFYNSRGNRLLMWLVPGAVLGYSMLVKGPISVIVFYAVVIPVLLYSKQIKRLMSFGNIGCLVLTFGSVAVWYYLASHTTDTSAMGDTMSSQMAARIFGKFNFKYWSLSVLDSALNFLPWLIFLGALWDKRSIENMPGDEKQLFKGLRLGMIISFAALNLMPMNHPRYSMPAVAPASLAVACALAYRKEFTASDKLWRVLLQILAVVTVGSCVAGMIKFDRSLWAFITLEVCIIVAAAALLIGSKLKTTTLLTGFTGVIVAVVMLQYAVFGKYFINTDDWHRPESANIKKVVPEGETLYLYRSKFQPVIFYLPKPLVRLTDPQQITDDMRYMFTTQEALDAEPAKSLLAHRKITKLYDVVHGRNGTVIVVDLGKVEKPPRTTE